ncbi:tRNA-modifying protein YgfZ [Providencia alcalifaciens]|jgi:folate-binding protein YgfZ|uniref:tRNA-modifying protein YgfZ n=1 Tax=Providencia TaxID=586 RepID=UPI000D379960|nr:tRNA-modifying protein YgfZ [Providencia alcalifaciens]MBG5882871.1 tRNA-modifying protein YgfZ [Providencia alcalifaciens]MDR2241678.1 tRNA-modifying protein YgfZ [Providencia alcalifaciens]MDR2988983.1 tRNA-modifying protein YgfZ [Providencia alcalifaciens]
MTSHVDNAQQFPLDSQSLPLVLISLENWELIHLHGADAEKYLQGQVTADISTLEHAHTLTAHCDPKGKMWSDLRLFHHLAGYSYIERRSVADAQLAELKKYAVFSKVTFEKKPELKLLGVAGQGAREALSSVFATLPDTQNQVIAEGNSTLLHFDLPAERFLIITDETTAQNITETLNATLVSDQQWLALEIAAGFAVIDQENSAQHLPQAANLQAIPYGISFKKGCYTGQEMVARAKFRGANKRAMYWLTGTGSSLPTIGDGVEWQLGENWRRTGTVLATVRLGNGELSIQIIMNNDMEADSVFRVMGDEQSRLTIAPLPYSLEEDK